MTKIQHVQKNYSLGKENRLSKINLILVSVYKKETKSTGTLSERFIACFKSTIMHIRKGKLHVSQRRYLKT